MSPKKSTSDDEVVAPDVVAAPSPTARDAVRQSQRIAIQLHQLIAASITVTALRSEREILVSLAGSTRAVFDADESVVTLEVGAVAPLRGVARRGKRSTWEVPTKDNASAVLHGVGVRSRNARGERVAGRAHTGTT